MMRFAYSLYRAIPTAADRLVVDPSSSDPFVIIHRPELKVRVCGPRRHPEEVPIWGLVDTGASECILPYEVADQVKPIWRGTGAISDYAGGAHAVRYGQVHLQIRVEKTRLRWPAVVAFSRERTSEALWGRRGFLDHFRVTFDGPEKSFIIRLRAPVPTGSMRRSHPETQTSRPQREQPDHPARSESLMDARPSVISGRPAHGDGRQSDDCRHVAVSLRRPRPSLPPASPDPSLVRPTGPPPSRRAGSAGAPAGPNRSIPTARGALRASSRP